MHDTFHLCTVCLNYIQIHFIMSQLCVNTTDDILFIFELQLIVYHFYCFLIY